MKSVCQFRSVAIVSALLGICVLLDNTTVSNSFAADDPVFSGPQAGEPLVPFTVTGVYDDAAGKDFNPVAEAGGKPSMLVFVHSLTRPGFALTRALTQYASSIKDPAAYTCIVWLSDNPAETERYLTMARGSLRVNVPLGVSTDGVEGPGAYGLNRNVELTILIAKDNQVTANFALVQPSLTEAPKIAAELAKVAGQPAPQAADLQQLAGMGMRTMRSREPARKSSKESDSPAAEPDLRTLLRGLAELRGSDDEFKAAVKKIEDWVGKQPERQQQLGRMSGFALERGLGSEQVQTQLRKWQKAYSPKQDQE